MEEPKVSKPKPVGKPREKLVPIAIKSLEIGWMNGFAIGFDVENDPDDGDLYIDVFIGVFKISYSKYYDLVPESELKESDSDE